MPPPRPAARRPFRSFLSDLFGRHGRGHAPRPKLRGEPGPAVELDCLCGVLVPEVLRAAARRSREVDVGADQVLIRAGIIAEEVYVAHLARHLGVAIERFADPRQGGRALRDAELHAAVRHAVLPLGDGVHAVAPRHYGARRLTRLVACCPATAARIRLAVTARLNEFIERRSGLGLGRRAAFALATRHPHLSAAPRIARSRWRVRLRHLARVALALVPATLVPEALWQAGSVVLALWFLLFTSLRLAASFPPRRREMPLPPLSDAELPVYTVIAALYREASSVAPLMRALDALDYPREKLDIKLVVEPDDLATRAALARLGPLPHVQTIVAPACGPRTKPKALNCALAFARGAFVTVFDAEDRPEPAQLRRALDAFRRGDADVACVQASLCIDNTADGWLPRMFTAEYAGQFDVFLQGFSHFEMPLPLGGSSNHFRTGVLRAVGGWDPYNVTEDADLGFRLARFGYRSVMFPSTTYEEAPASLAAWLRQRTRWMKGWMQTWSVHMRAPWRLWREAGARGFFTLNIVLGGNVLTALAHPLLIGNVAFAGLRAVLGGEGGTFLAGQFLGLHAATIATGYLSTVVTGVIGLARRRLLHEAWVLALTPLYWVCLSLAAWRALWQLLRDPYRWEKTEHGLARTSRVAAPPYPARRATARARPI